MFDISITHTSPFYLYVTPQVYKDVTYLQMAVSVSKQQQTEVQRDKLSCLLADCETDLGQKTDRLQQLSLDLESANVEMQMLRDMQQSQSGPDSGGHLRCSDSMISMYMSSNTVETDWRTVIVIK